MFNLIHDRILSFYNNYISKNEIIKYSGLSFVVLFFIILTMKITVLIIFTLFKILYPITYFIDILIRIIILIISKFYNKKTIFGYYPLNQSRLKIFLDLDNTLIYSTFYKLPNINPILIYDNKYNIYKRPYLDTFLTTLYTFADLFIYTSSTQDYADKILKVIDKKGIIKKKYYRQNCINYQNRYFKDILKLNSSLSNSDDLIIIDDNPSIYLNMRENIIPIKFWAGEQNDDSLLKIKNIIKNYYNSGNENVKEFIKKTISYDI